MGREGQGKGEQDRGRWDGQAWGGAEASLQHLGWIKKKPTRLALNRNCTSNVSGVAPIALLRLLGDYSW